MKARHLMIRRPAGVVPAGLVCLSIAVTLSRQPARADAASLPNAPSGFSNGPVVPAGGGLGDLQQLREGFSMETSLADTYSSNITHSPGEPYGPIKDDFILSAGGNFNYLSKAETWTFGGNYHGRYDDYLDYSTYSAYNQGGSVVANYTGGNFFATLNAGAESTRGANYYYSSAFVEQISYHAAFTGRYILSPKTSLEANLTENYNTTTGGAFYNTVAYDAGLSALWKYSPLTEFGPGIRYTYRAGTSNDARTTIGPTAVLNYKLSTKVSLTSRVGLDFISYQNGGEAAPTVSAGLGLNYQASQLWGMDFSFYRDSQADPTTAGRFIDVNALHLGYHRKLLRATLNLGVGYEMNSYTSGGTATVASEPPQNHFTADASLGMKIFHNTTMASVFVRYEDMRAAPTNTYHDIQTGLSLSRKF